MSVIPVAEYVRMSTEDQKYSIPSQQAAIRRYATEHGLLVCKTYSDPGKSGVLIKYRPALSQLLQDVLSGGAEYKAILVYDVSRWGRFQNPDESAHYEFICAKAGVPVHYCAEQFSNDGSLQSILMKAVKRTMAGEFSRELGTKVFEGVKRLVLDGFHAGGVAPYGLDRMLISATGHKKGRLKRGEAKNLKSDHVVLVRGNRKEIQTVQKIFTMCAHENKSVPQIAATLNASGSSWRGQPWDFDKVHRVLTSSVYLGLNVWAKRSVRLHGPNVRRPKALWVTSKARFRPIVDQVTFDQAQKAIAARRISYNCPELLAGLRRLVARKNRLSVGTINRSKAMAHTTTYKKHFGSLLTAYEMAGFKPASSRYAAVEHTHAIKILHRSIVDTLTRLFPGHVRILRNVGDQRYIIEVDGHFRVSVLPCGYRPRRSGRKCSFWLLRVSKHDRDNIALICTLDREWKEVDGYYLLRPLGDSVQKHHRLRRNDPLLSAGQKLTGLEEFCVAVRALGRP
jgi:DNA invertase Pin-like site-specific DNA recombinase